jgi:transcriptional regulator with XRE-family HTH domain
MTNTADLPKYLATNLQVMRLKRGFTQASLAKMAKLPRSSITYMESGGGNPSLSNLMKVAEALNVSLEELLSRPKEDYKLIKNDEVKRVLRSHGQAIIKKLLPEPIPGTEIDHFELKPQTKMIGVPHLPHTREHLIVLEGSISVLVSGNRFELEKGDVFSFPGDQHHSYENAEKKTALAISVVVFDKII